MFLRGLSFLDEFPEFPRSVLEALRQPMEDGLVQISRAAGTMTFPSKFILIAASNPCPCGYLGSKKKACTCLPGQVTRYKKRISGPILDRIDIHLTVPEVKVDRLTKDKKFKPETSKKIRKRVQKARDQQIERFRKTKLVCNAEMSTKEVKKYCSLDSDCLKLMQLAVEKMDLSARGYFRVVKVARTIADLAQEERISSSHIAEALQYRKREENY